MIIHDKMVDVIRNALVDYESATGLECQIRYADRLSAVVEVVLELAEEMPETVARTPIVSRMPAVEVVPLGAPNATELQTETESTESDDQKMNTYQRSMAMKQEGKNVADIARFMGMSVSTVYDYIKFGRDQEAK